MKKKSIVEVQKQSLREKVFNYFARQKKEERVKKSRKIMNLLFSLPEFARADMVMFYVALGNEVNTRPMIREAFKSGKKVVVPVTKREKKGLLPSLLTDYGRELVKGPYGVYEPARPYQRPVSVEKIDLVIVPGVAFDSAGSRLGRGKGYYDRFLKSLPDRIPTIGLAFEFQVRENLPTLSHDVSVDKVLYA